MTTYTAHKIQIDAGKHLNRRVRQSVSVPEGDRIQGQEIKYELLRLCRCHQLADFADASKMLWQHQRWGVP